QSAAGSELGKMVIRLGRHDGFKTMNVVRRPESMDELRSLGADAVICTDGSPITQQIREIVGEPRPRFAIDSVGGTIGSELFKSLGLDGRLLAYGSLSEQPIEVESRHLIARRCQIEGFWLGHFMRQQSVPTTLGLFREIAHLMRKGILTTQVFARHPIESYQ